MTASKGPFFCVCAFMAGAVLAARKSAGTMATLVLFVARGLHDFDDSTWGRR